MTTMMLTRHDDRDDEAGADVAVTARALTKRYGRIAAVDDLSFDVGWGRVAGFLGPNGAGKSTTLRMLLGLITPTSGEARIAGERFRSISRPATIVGAALDAAAFDPSRTGLDHLRILAAAGHIDGNAPERALAMVELQADARRRVREYSLGMRQRLALAAALLGDPRILILDEPANGLDPAGIRWLRGLLRDFADTGKAVLVSSHLLGELAQLADDLIVIDRGRLITTGTVAELTQQGAAARVRTPEPERLAAALRNTSVEISHREGTLVIHGTTPEMVGAIAAEHGIVLHELTLEQRSLEDAFLHLVGGQR